METIAFVIIAAALIFDFLNGMNDAANSVATVISTKVLSPWKAVVWAAAFNFLAYFLFGTEVAKAIGSGILAPHDMGGTYLLAAILSAGSCLLAASLVGLPLSASHALIGGLIGPGLWYYGTDAFIWSGLMPILLFIVLSPLIGFVLSAIIQKTLYFIDDKTDRVQPHYGKLQLLSSALLSLGHGANDAQKTMGIIALVLFQQGVLGSEFHVPTWLALLCYLTLALGTLAGGWKVIETIGSSLTHLTRQKGFAAESSAAISLGFSTVLGIPVSSTHTITGAIIGTGALESGKNVAWKLAGRIATAWVLTIPVSAIIAIFLEVVVFGWLK